LNKQTPLRAMPLWALLVGTLSLITLVTTYVGGEFIRSKEEPRLLARGHAEIESILTLVASSIADTVVVQDIPVLKKVISDMSGITGGVHSVRIVNDYGQVLLNWQSKEPTTGELSKFAREIRRGEDQYFGKLLLVWDNGETLKEIAEQINDARINIAIFMFVTSLLLLVWMHTLVINPVMRINQRLVMGASSEKLKLHWWTAKEFGRLKRTVTRLEEVTISRDELEKEVERRKDAEVALLDLRDKALEANRAKSTFLANMSHELRTPLNAIIGYSEMLQDDAKSDGLKEYSSDLEKIHAAGRHLLTLINEVLDLSKVEAGKMELHIEPFNLPDLINVVVSTVEPMARKNSNEIVCEGLSSVEILQADFTKVRQILLNLLSNAVKFTEHGEIFLTVKNVVADGIEGVEINVKDSGIGIDQEAADKIFEPFQQADISTTRKYGGTGLGLSLCRNFCEMMGGKIWVGSEVGSGATFSIWLPLEVAEATLEDRPAKPRKKEQGVDPKTVRLPESISKHLKKQERRKKVATVLTIDDDPNVVELMARVYNREGFRAIAAYSGIEGVEMARKLKPDLITLDIMMPGMDGWDTLKLLKQDAELCDIPVIMVSIVENKPMALDIGALASLTKPVAWDRLLDLTRMAVRGKISSADNAVELKSGDARK
jgi:signal transduction histidine kinase/ActR/RegA family two-component response regulator